MLSIQIITAGLFPQNTINFAEKSQFFKNFQKY